MSARSRKINHLQIYKELNRSNCRDCGVPTCMAFALSVVNGERNISDCPHLPGDVAREIEGRIIKRDRGGDIERTIGPLKKAVEGVKFSSVAEGLGAEVVEGRLRIRCLGKDFFVDAHGNVESAVHVNQWIMMPLLKYIKNGGNRRFSGRWISFEELHGGAAMAGYFRMRCEEPMRRLAESHTSIFIDLLNIFGAERVEEISADYSGVIYPLPRLPFLVIYRSPDEGFESSLRILLDGSADDYLDAHSIYVLGRGIVEMFKRILSRHEELLPALLAL